MPGTYPERLLYRRCARKSGSLVRPQRRGGVPPADAVLSWDGRGEAPRDSRGPAVVPPFVVEEHGHVTDFSIDLWEEVARKLDALQTGKADIVVTGLVHTAERDREFDFTYSILNTGLQVMVRSTGQGEPDRPLIAFVRLLFSTSMLYWLGGALLLLLVPAHVIWFIDRRNRDGISSGENYLPGIFHAMTWAAEGLPGQAMLMPKCRHA